MQVVNHADNTATVYLKTYGDVKEMVVDYLLKKNIISDGDSVSNAKFLTDSHCEELINTISVIVTRKDA